MEDKAGYVRQIDGRIIDDSEFGIRVSFCCCSRCISKHVANADDQIIILINKSLQVRSIVSVRSGFQIVNSHTKLLACSLKSFPGRLVEGTIVYTTYVSDQTYFELRSIFGVSSLSAISALLSFGSICSISRIASSASSQGCHHSTS